MKTRLKAAAAAVLVAGSLGAGSARAQGIPVIDIANLIQTILQVLNDVTEINNQVQQITQLQDQLNSINGIRNLGNVFNNPMLKNYVPAGGLHLPQRDQHLGVLGPERHGEGTARRGHALQLHGPVRRCADQLPGRAGAAVPAEGLLQDAMKSAAGRLSQIQSLMGQINATTDQKAVQEIQARIGAENALLAHEMSQCRCCRAWPTARSASRGRASANGSTRCSCARARWPTTCPDPSSLNRCVGASSQPHGGPS
jgi:type IV secretion system protein VirB5